MLCERCKLREANIQYTEVVNGVKYEHNFCMQCAKEMNFGEYSALFEGDFPLAKLLTGLLGDDSHGEDDKTKKIECPKCHMTYGEFVNNSRFGCEVCYDTFDLLIRDNIKKLQGSDQYRGMGVKIKAHSQIEDENKQIDKELGIDRKKPSEKELKEREIENRRIEGIRILKNRLTQAISVEDYELAAKCRDEIRAIEKGEMDV